MRFPFFATNRRVSKLDSVAWKQSNTIFDIANENATGLSDLEQKVRVLEGRLNKLEDVHKPTEGRHIYTHRQWTRMTKERKRKFLNKLSAEDGQRFLQMVEADKKCLKR